MASLRAASTSLLTLPGGGLRCLAPLAEAPHARLCDLPGGEALLALVAAAHGRLTLISGAGISTASGIPDYRSPERPAYKPLQHGEFIQRFSVRRRYWARSMLGWPRMAGAAPNSAHHAVTALQAHGALGSVITQNVDRLHQLAGARDVLELHGTIHDVGCEACGSWHISRAELQPLLVRRNAAWLEQWAPAAAPRPDGDVELPSEAYDGFTSPLCSRCGSDLVKPKVTFHGGSVPQHVTERSLATARASELLLVVGSTLSTWSAFRLAKATVAAGGRVAVVNFGATRADELACVRVAGHTSSVLAALARELGAAALATGAPPPPPPPQPQPQPPPQQQHQ